MFISILFDSKLEDKIFCTEDGINTCLKNLDYSYQTTRNDRQMVQLFKLFKIFMPDLKLLDVCTVYSNLKHKDILKHEN